jgi:peptidoglycan/LPS O-acetylase OafA/YrhL
LGTRFRAVSSAIDGLRAIAVLAVFFFHLQRGLLPGGFVGVDIFFVISGYLITSILLRECETGKFSLGKFSIKGALHGYLQHFYWCC